MHYQIIVFTLGVMLSILGVAEIVPALVDWSDGHANARVFFLNSLFCLFFGLSFVLGNKSFKYEMNIRQTFMLTTLSWVFFSLFSAIPFCMADIKASFTDALFESVSGYTTTGSTVFSGLDKMSRGILLWRSITHWIGGIGIIALAIICLPMLQVGGMQLFQTESSDKSAKLMPKNFDFVMSFIAVYVGISALCALTYFLLGMSFFDAINHAMATIATGGFSTHDKSFAHYDNPALYWAGSFFMFAGALPFVLYIKLVYQRHFDFFKDDQFNFFCIIIAGIVFVLTAWVWNHTDYTLFESLTHVTFMVVSTITTTGFVTADFMLWGTLAPVVFLYVLYLGGCAGSTAGGIKTMRIVIIFRALMRQIKRLLYPHGAFTVTYQGNTVSQQNVMAVLCFSGLYVVTNVVMTICLTLVGLDFETAISGAATAIGNVGYGTGAIIGPAGNFSSLPDPAKWLLTLSMLLGRLEIMTALVLFTPDYWKK